MIFSTQPTKKNKKRRIEKRKEKRGEREAHSSENSNAHLLLGDDNLLFVVRSPAIHTGWFQFMHESKFQTSEKETELKR